jgi:signal transduction histidine kinase
VGNVKYRSYVADIHESGMHLLQLINDILDLTKAEAGKVDLCEDVCDIGEIVRSVARLRRASIATAGLTIAINVPPRLARLRADERKVRQVLFSLISDAV